jgi:hypothetical protein
MNELVTTLAIKTSFLHQIAVLWTLSPWMNKLMTDWITTSELLHHKSKGSRDRNASQSRECKVITKQR